MPNSDIEFVTKVLRGQHKAHGFFTGVRGSFAVISKYFPDKQLQGKIVQVQSTDAPAIFS